MGLDRRYFAIPYLIVGGHFHDVWRRVSWVSNSIPLAQTGGNSIPNERPKRAHVNEQLSKRLSNVWFCWVNFEQIKHSYAATQIKSTDSTRIAIKRTWDVRRYVEGRHSRAWTRRVKMWGLIAASIVWKLRIDL